MQASSYYYQDLVKLTKLVANKDNRRYVILNNSIGSTKDIQKLFLSFKNKANNNSRLLIIYYNHLWELVLNFATFVGWRKKVEVQNWLDTGDINNLLNLSGLEIITTQKRMLFPIKVSFISDIINKYLAHLPLINSLCLTTWTVARKKPEYTNKQYSVSIIIPARNEEGNIANIVPKFGKSQEIIFVEGNSKDNTWKVINNQITKYTNKQIKIKAYKQTGKGKADAVRLGFEKATGDILMIYDADRTVDASDLPKFYNALTSGVGEFANGSRLVYPMEKDSMRILNKIGNSIFSWVFTWILGQHFKDTLCGTKVIWKNDFLKMKKDYLNYLKIDPFGDFALIFAAIKHNLKVVEIPIRYKEREYGSTNISRFRHGLLLLKMTFRAFVEFRAW
jgi:hypothetical protein